MGVWWRSRASTSAYEEAPEEFKRALIDFSDQYQYQYRYPYQFSDERG